MPITYSYLKRPMHAVLWLKVMRFENKIEAFKLPLKFYLDSND